MGTYVQFWLGADDGLLGHFLAGPLDAFRAWCDDTIVEFPGELDPLIVPLVEKIRTSGPAALEAHTAGEAAVVDDLMSAYYGSFCDFVRKDQLEMVGDALLYVSRYDTIADVLINASDKRVESLLWSFIRSGRAIGRDQATLPYTSGDDAFRLSYWTADETELLGDALTGAPDEWLRDCDTDAMECTLMAIRAAISRRTGLIITVA